MSNKHTFDTFDSAGYHRAQQSRLHGRGGHSSSLSNSSSRSSGGRNRGREPPPQDTQSYHSGSSSSSLSSASSSSSSFDHPTSYCGRHQYADVQRGRGDRRWEGRRRTLTIRIPTILEVAEAVLPFDRTTDILKVSCLCNIITCACVVYLCTVAAKAN